MASTSASDTGYERLTAKAILTALPSMDVDELGRLEILERSGKNRVTVLRGIAALQASVAQDVLPVAAADPDMDEAAPLATPRTEGAEALDRWAASDFTMPKLIDVSSNKPALPGQAVPTPIPIPASEDQVRKPFAERGGIQFFLVVVVIFAIGAWAIEKYDSSTPSSTADTTTVTYPIIRTTGPGYQTPTTVKTSSSSVSPSSYSSTSFTGDSGNVPTKAFGAFEMCKQFVRDRLKAPSGATWRNPSGNQVTYSGSGSGPWTVDASVDAQNGFGAKVRMEYTCIVTNTSGDSWSLNSLVTSDD